MDRINHPTAPGRRFVEHDPLSGTPGTIFAAPHFNAVQDELVNTIEAAGLTPDEGDVSQLEQAIRTLATGNGGLKNLVVNGGFRFWQRGTSLPPLTATERYTADRWVVAGDGPGGSGVATLTRGEFSVGQPDVPGARFFARYQQTSPATAGGGRLVTKIEALEQLAGGEVSVSFYAKATTALTATLNFVNVYGAASSATVATAPVALTTSWQRFKITRTMPSVAGQSVDHAVSHVRVELVLPTGSPLVDLAQFQLERAPIASPFEERPDALELQLCQRYFEKSYDVGTAPGSSNTLVAALTAIAPSLAQLATVQGVFRVPKRAAPTIAWYSPTSGLIGRVLHWTNSADLTVSGTQHISRNATGWPIIATAFESVQLVLAHWTADAEL